MAECIPEEMTATKEKGKSFAGHVKTRSAQGWFSSCLQSGFTLNLPFGKATSPVVMQRERKCPGNFQEMQRGQAVGLSSWDMGKIGHGEMLFSGMGKMCRPLPLGRAGPGTGSVLLNIAETSLKA